MSLHDEDGSFVLEMNGDQTQVFATIRPPLGGGRAVTERDIAEWMTGIGVVRGQRPEDIHAAVVECCRERRVVRAIVAQGVLPVDGTDARVIWAVNSSALNKPPSRLADGSLDLFAIDERRFVQQDQLLATIIPARHGRPGQAVTASSHPVPPAAPKETVLIAGLGVRVSVDGTKFYAEASGYVELARDKVSVTPMTMLSRSLGPGMHRFTGSVVIRGDVAGAYIDATGAVAVAGTADGASIRARAGVHLRRATGSQIATEGNVYVTESMALCDVITGGKLVAAEKAKVSGGSICATAGVDAWELGSPAFDETRLTVGEDGLRDLREREISADITSCEENLVRIDKALKSMTSVSARASDVQRRDLAEALRSQRRELEAHLGNLRSEARHFAFGKITKQDVSVEAAGIVHPGVIITICGVSVLNEVAQSGVAWSWDSRRKAIVEKHQYPECAA